MAGRHIFDGVFAAPERYQRCHDFAASAVWVLLGVFCFSLLGGCFGQNGFAGDSSMAQPLKECDAFFQSTNGWIGADGAYSVALNDHSTVWLFDDTIVGAVRNGKRARSAMVHNTLATQPLGQKPTFYYPTNRNGHPEAVFNPTDGAGYFWPLDGIREGPQLCLFMARVRPTGAGGVWGFEVFGCRFVTVENPDNSPALWKSRQVDLPFNSFAKHESRLFGWAVLDSGNSVYVYGALSRQNRRVGTILGRAPKGKLADFSAWSFFAAGRWQPDFQKATPICEEAPTEGSVSWQPALRKFIMVYMNDLAPEIQLRTAPSPAGPWSAPEVIYRCPDSAASKSYFCYAGKAHPELSAPSEAIITYICNSTTFADLFNDAAIYRPRFVAWRIPPAK